MTTIIDERERWQQVAVDDVPINALVRYRDRDRAVTGIAVDELAGAGATGLIVLDEDGGHHVVPASAEVEMLVSRAGR